MYRRRTTTIMAICAMLIGGIAVAEQSGPASAATSSVPSAASTSLPSAQVATGAAAPVDISAVVPTVHDWTAGGGTTVLSNRSRLLIDRSAIRSRQTAAGVAEFPGPVQQTAGDLVDSWRQELRSVTRLGLPVSRDASHPRPDDVVLRLVDDTLLGAEGYRLDTSGPVVLEAATTNGLYYGTRTVNQLLAKASGHRSLPSGVATDVPDQAVRMVQLDAGRKYWSMNYLQDLIRRMGELKLNTLFLHLSESEGFRLNSPKFPGLADPRSSYSRQDIEKLKRLGAERHVQIMGGIDLPGHATRISQTYGIGFGAGGNPCTQAQTHSHLTPDWIIDMTSTKAIGKTKEMVAEFSSWFDAPLFSIGADELPGQLANCERVKNFVAADPDVSSLGDLLTRYINTMDDAVRAGGKRTAIYNGVEHMDSPQQSLHPSIVDLTWEGTGSEPAIDGHDEIAIGPFYLTPNNYHNLYPDPAWIHDNWTPSDATDMLGSGMPSWADYNFWSADGYFEQFMALPRATLADRTWNASTATDTVQEFTERAGDLGEPIPIDSEQRPASGHRNPIHHWTFDNASYPAGWTWAGSPGNTIMVQDTAGNLPGTSYIINNPTVIDDAVAGQAFRFDNPKDGVGFGGLDLAAPWTVSTWVRLSKGGGDQVLLSSADGAIKLSQNGTGAVGISSAGGPDYSFAATLPVGEWVQVTLAADRSSTTLYLDGVKAGRIGAAIPLPLRSIGTPKASLYGDLDELLAWDRTLSGAEVKKQFDGYHRAPGDYRPTVDSLNNHPTAQWFDSDKFGIFIHWGAYSVPAWGPRGSYAEWYWNYMNSTGTPTNAYHKSTYGQDFPYDEFINRWKADKFDPDAWVKLFQDAGAKYFVLTSKHHEGVALFDSKVSGRDTVDLGPHRDLAKDLFDAARRDTDLKAGFYYSLYEWSNPSYTGRPATNPYTGAEVPYTGAPAVEDYVQQYMKPQMTELIDQYDPDILWCDGQWDKPASYWDTAPVIADFYNRAKNRTNPKEVVVANRCKIQTGDLDSPELDFQTPEYTTKSDIDPIKWEASRGIAHSYGYNQNEPVEDYLTSDQLVDSLVDIVSKNGNLLLDIGPRGDGTIPELQAQRLRDIGAWLKINGEAIYGTTYWSTAEDPSAAVPIRYTMKGDALYAIAQSWPGEKVTLGAGVPSTPGTKVTLLGSDGKPLHWSKSDDGTLTIDTPATGEKATKSTNAFVFKIVTPGLTSLVRGGFDLPAEIAPGTSATGRLSITNPGGKDLGRAHVELSASNGVAITPTAVDLGTLPAGQTASLPVQITLPAGAAGRPVITARVVVDGVSQTVTGSFAVALPNLAKDRPATQSSTAWDGAPSRAVDGNRDGVFGNGSVTHTAEPSSQAWWQVDLGASHPVDRVDVFNRSDCCSDRLANYWVITSDQPITADSLEQARSAPGVTAIRTEDTAGRPTTIALPAGTTARYVRIQLESTVNPLSLAEVEVRGG